MEMKNLQVSNHETYQVELYKTIREVGNILSQQITIDIIFHLSHEPLRYKQLKSLLKCTDNTLSRRLKKLQEYDIIERLTVVLGNKQGHEYTITDLGQELIKFFEHYEQKRCKNIKERGKIKWQSD